VPGEFDPDKHEDAYLPVRGGGAESRKSNLLQSVLVAVHSEDTHISPLGLLRLSVHSWNQFWERIQLLFITPQQRYK
jgi:boron transporter